MADTQKTVAQVLTSLADNVSGAISPQDLRDAFVTWRPGHGQLYVSTADAAAITIPDTVNYVECTAPVWSLSPAGYLFDESAGNGRLTYTGVVPVFVMTACAVSMSSASANQESRWRLGVNGVTDAASETIRFISTGSDIGSTSTHLMVSLNAGDYVSLFVRNASAANNLIIESASVQILSMPT
jgi:hypothetical protein